MRWSTSLCGLVFFASISLVIYCIFQITSGKIEVQQRLEAWDSLSKQETATKFGHPPSQASEVMGKIILPDIDLQLPIIYGTSDEDLKKGVGYDPLTPIPGTLGNCVLAGHRDSVFRRLGELQSGDDIIIETAFGTFHYHMVSHIIVDKNNLNAVQPSQKPLLTLITCYPFSYIGDAPQRYIITAKMKGDS